MRHWNINGSPLAVIPSSHQHAFSLKFNLNNHQYEVHRYVISWYLVSSMHHHVCVCVCVCTQVLTSSGDSAEIDVFMNFGYKALSLTLS